MKLPSKECKTLKKQKEAAPRPYLSIDYPWTSGLISSINTP